MLRQFVNRFSHQTKYIQAVNEVADSLSPLFKKDQKYEAAFINMAIPERIIKFKVAWKDDSNEINLNQGYRVQYNSALGPYKGGLRFHSDVNLDTFKFLGFEQTFKNSLTGLTMGGAKGGADFNPFGKSESEIQKFCEAYMTELYRHIGPDTDVPAGDIGVSNKEIGYLYNQYRKIKNIHEGVLTGKAVGWGGSRIRTEATGYGISYILKEAMDRNNDTIKGKDILISGAGNVAQYTAKKILTYGGNIKTLSNDHGTMIFNNNLTSDMLEEIIERKKNRERLHDMHHLGEFHTGKKPWDIVKNVDIVLPCATENEIDEDNAKSLINHGCNVIVEGSNMPSTPEAVEIYNKNNILYIPSKMANAGGVAVSGLEMAQNAGKVILGKR